MIARKLHNMLHPKVGEVWMLHRVVERLGAGGGGSLAVEAGWLARRLDHALASGAHFVAIAEVEGCILRREPFVCLTFDDGYLDTLTHALPMLRERGLPFCLYATRDFYRHAARPAWDPTAPMLSARQLREMDADPLCTVGAHTCSHPRLSTLPPDAQRRELALGRDDLQQLLGHEVAHTAFPHGDHNRTTLRLCHELGFRTAATANGRTVRTDSSPLHLDRIGLVQPTTA